MRTRLYGTYATIDGVRYTPTAWVDKRGLVFIRSPKRFPTEATFQFIWATLHFTAAILHFSSGVYHSIKLARSHHDATRRR